MIQYTDNVFGRRLSDCPEATFRGLCHAPSTRAAIEAFRHGDATAKKRVPCICVQGRGTARKKEGMTPTGLVMHDFDHLDDPHTLFATMQRQAPALGLRRWVAWVTASAHGLRIITPLRHGSTIADDQQWLADRLGATPDPAIKDISRLCLVPLPEDILRTDDLAMLWDEAEEEGLEPKAESLESKAESVESKDESVESKDESVESGAEGSDVKNESMKAESEGLAAKTEHPDYPDHYNGTPYSTITATLTDLMGGAPAHGSRNQTIYAMACQLRHICNDDPEWVMHVIPTFGEAADKARATVKSACNSFRTPVMPRLMATALRISGTPDQSELPVPPPMPAKLPPLIEAVTRNVPPYMRPSLSQACFPALAAHVSRVAFRYIDNVLHEPSLMHVQVGKTAAGKGYINEPLRHITADIEAEDSIARAAEEEWRMQCQSLGANKQKPPRPELPIRLVSTNMTNAIFVQRIIAAEKGGAKMMFSKFNEIELLDDIAKGLAGGRREVSKIIRVAYDNDEYGQERFGAQAVSGKAHIRWNLVASTTVQNARNYFREMIADGTMNRLAFSYIEPQDRDRVPVTGIYDERYISALQPYIEALTRTPEPTAQYDDVVRETTVTDPADGTQFRQLRIADITQPYVTLLPDGRTEVFCPEAWQLAQQLNQENAQTVILSGDQVYDSFTLRANVIAYKKALLLYMANGCRWDPTFEPFVRWSEQYDLWVKMNLFGDTAQQKMSGENLGTHRGPTNMLDSLPTVFTRSDLATLRRQRGMDTNVNNQINNWAKRHYIIRLEDGRFKKAS